MGKEFERPESSAAAGSTSAGGAEGGDEELRPVDVDLNLVKNLLESYSLQQVRANQRRSTLL